MRETLMLLAAPFGLWLIATPWVDGDPSTVGTVGGTVAGALLLAAVTAAVLTSAKPAAVLVVGALGALIAVGGVVALPAGLGVRVVAVLVGLVAVALAALVRALPVPGRILAVNKRGGTLAEIKSLKVKDGKIAAPSILLGSMPETVYVTPDQVWNLLGAIGFDLVKALPGMLLRGRAQARRGEPAPVDAAARR